MNIPRPLTVLVILMVVSPIVLGTATVQAQSQPETANEYLDTFRSMDNEEALQQYSEIENIRSQAVTRIQVGTFDDAERQQMDVIRNLLQSFIKAYELREEGSISASFEEAEETEKYIKELGEVGGGELSSLARLSIERFYTQIGEQVEESALQVSSTPAKIEQYELAIEAYKRAGDTNRFSDLTVRKEELSATYQTDLETLNSTVTIANEFESDCLKCKSPGRAVSMGPAVFSNYVQARELKSGMAEATTIIQKHNLDTRESEVQSLANSINSIHTTLATGSAILVMVYAGLIGLIAGLIASRIVAWERDLSDSRVDEIVTIARVKR